MCIYIRIRWCKNSFISSIVLGVEVNEFRMCDDLEGNRNNSIELILGRHKWWGKCRSMLRWKIVQCAFWIPKFTRISTSTFSWCTRITRLESTKAIYMNCEQFVENSQQQGEQTLEHIGKLFPGNFLPPHSTSEVKRIYVVAHTSNLVQVVFLFTCSLDFTATSYEKRHSAHESKRTLESNEMKFFKILWAQKNGSIRL